MLDIGTTPSLDNEQNIILEKIISSIKVDQKNPNEYYVMQNTGPKYLTKVYFENSDIFLNYMNLILPSNYCYPYPSFLIKSSLKFYDEIKFFNGDGLTLNDSSNTNLLKTDYDIIDDTKIDVSSGAFWQQIGWNDQSYSRDNLNDASKVSVSTGGLGTTVYTFHDVVNILKKLDLTKYYVIYC